MHKSAPTNHLIFGRARSYQRQPAPSSLPPDRSSNGVGSATATGRAKTKGCKKVHLRVHVTGHFEDDEIATNGTNLKRLGIVAASLPVIVRAAALITELDNHTPSLPDAQGWHHVRVMLDPRQRKEGASGPLHRRHVSGPGKSYVHLRFLRELGQEHNHHQHLTRRTRITKDEGANILTAD